jgi:hypothetical protein
MQEEARVRAQAAAASPTDGASAPVAMAPARDGAAPFATEASLREAQGAYAGMEERLMRGNMERDRLRGELEHLGPGEGKTLATRRRRAEADARLAEVEADLSRVRLWLRQHAPR